MVDCCLRTHGLGYEVFNVANDDTSVAITSAEVYDRFYAGVPKRGELAEFQSFYSNDKAKRLVGFAPRHSWRGLIDTSTSDMLDVSGTPLSGSQRNTSPGRAALSSPARRSIRPAPSTATR